MDLKNYEVCVCPASYGLDEDQWQAVVNVVTNSECPYNVCNCILSDVHLSNLKMEAVCSSQTLIFIARVYDITYQKIVILNSSYFLLAFHLDEIHCHPGLVLCVGGLSAMKTMQVNTSAL
jgi:hypothetical protein